VESNLADASTDQPENDNQQNQNDHEEPLVTAPLEVFQFTLMIAEEVTEIEVQWPPFLWSKRSPADMSSSCP
jgi:hypothetical protein